MNCPHCSVFIEYNTLTETLPDAEKTCPKCSKGFVIENSVAKRLPVKKKPQKA